MRVIETEKLFQDRNLMKTVGESLVNGYVFVYPTDTVYGLGCNAEVRDSVERIAGTKGRAGKGKPFSVIVPSPDWIYENCMLPKINAELIEQLLPGPYTLVMKTRMKIPNVVSRGGTIGVRIPRNRFTDFVRKQGILFVTTSANLKGQEPVKNINEVPKPIRDIADFAIDAGTLENPSSRVFDLTGEKIEILRF